MKYLLSLLLIFSLIACSGSQSVDEEGAEDGVEMAEGADGDEFSDEFAEESGEEVAEDLEGEEGGEEGLLDEGGEEVADSGEAMEEDLLNDSEANTDSTAMSDGGTGMEESQPVSIDNSYASSGGSGTHTVRSGETLMLIAFKIYGDYEKWREIARMNQGKIGPGYSISCLLYTSPSPRDPE